MTDSHQELFDRLCAHFRETALLSSIGSLLHWDERTMLPAAGGPYRGEQATLLAGMVHRRVTDPRVGEMLALLIESDLARDPHSDAGATIRQLHRQYERAARLPQPLVEELARLAVVGQQTWAEARRKDDFAAFLPVLEQIVRLCREKAEAYGYETNPYDALLDEYEPYATEADVGNTLRRLQAELTPLVAAIAESARQPDESILRRRYPVAAQREFGRRLAEAIGFDFRQGRLDETDHPFCCTAGPRDCRITTRYDETLLPQALFGILHEAGHGLYEQGLRPEWFGLPPGSAVSLGIHESQSRLWENLVGRSFAFWQRFFPEARRLFPEALGDVAVEQFHAAINAVRPSLIRVEADEVTYNLHIVVRFELEQAMLLGSLAPADLPEAWREKYAAYLGVVPADDAEGVLQDIHWSGAAIGYFPTYALGNMYAAQFFEAARRDLGDLDRQIAAGAFDPLREWLRDRIYAVGQQRSAADLIEHVTGAPLSHGPLMAQLHAKYAPLYGL